MPAPRPDNEGERLEALHACRLLDTAPEAAFDDVTRLAAQICGVPIAAITLIDEDRQWFKSIQGLDITETPRDLAFCAHTILQPDLLVVSDTQQDARFADNPFVTGMPHVRFYAGAPLLSAEGLALGSLCAIDTLPRQLTPEQKTALLVLARQVSNQIELNRRIAQQERLIAEKEQLIAERAAAEAALESEREFQRALLESLQEGIVACDAQGMLSLFNRAAREFHGLPEEPLPPEQWAEHFDLYEADGVTPMRTEDVPLFRALQGEAVRGAEMVIAPKGGPARTLRASGQAIYDEQNKKLGAVVAMHDITEGKHAEESIRDYSIVLEFQKLALEKANAELERANAELETLATQDGLTGLKNHRTFHDQLAMEIERAARYEAPLSLLLLDVDHFKDYNDAFGHPAGDDALRHVAYLLRQNARETDFAARYGGEEFALLLPQTDGPGAMAIAERIRAAIESYPWPQRGVTASVGVFSLGPDRIGSGRNAGRELMTGADVALYSAKAAGRNRVIGGSPAHAAGTVGRESVRLAGSPPAET